MNKRKSGSAMDAVYAARRQNLRLLVEKFGGTGALGTALGYTSGSFISQIISDPPQRNLTEGVARDMESKLRLASGWLDIVYGGVQ